MKKKRVFLYITLGMIFIILTAFYAWSQVYYDATPNALEYLKDSGQVTVEKQDNIITDTLGVTSSTYTFIPEGKKQNIGVIFYPGGKVDARAYAYLGYGLANKGYKTVIVQMPLKLAVFSPGYAEKIINKHSGIGKWVIGGHSLGGSMAASFTRNNPEHIKGLFLLASYPASSVDLRNLDIDVLSLSGDKDGIADAEKIKNSSGLLPIDRTVFIEIEGANHSQFGDYGFQKGDLEADISQDRQHEIVINSVLELLHDQ